MLIDPQYIKIVANSATPRYKSMVIKKRDGSDRQIYQPSRELKAIQRVLHDDLLSRLPIHPSAYAYREKINLKDHINAHRNSNFIARFDFKNFFPSIDKIDIEKFINDNCIKIDKEWTSEDTKLFVNLVCFKGALIIGAVTSPIISNSICYQLDKKISQICSESEVIYTRYADDIYFSTNEPNTLLDLTPKLIKVLRNIEYPRNLWLNKKKTIHTSKKRLRKITGLVLTPEGKVSIGRAKKRELRTQIYQWDTFSPKQKLSIKGTLAYISSIEPDLINRLCKKFGSKKVYNIIKYSAN